MGGSKFPLKLPLTPATLKGRNAKAKCRKAKISDCIAFARPKAKGAKRGIQDCSSAFPLF
ncbi:hypothetical protein BKH46_08950 [Helicobacter sp. 12S02634-8]|nr:hypothetical protein BKH46_08950 [Helicobacter sp. 12S02634-8]